MKNFTITEVSKLYQISTATIRYYEKIGLIRHIPRRDNGNRYFEKQTLEWLEMIVCLRNSGVPVDVLVHYADLVKAGPKTLDEQAELLAAQKQNLENQRNQLSQSIARLNHKINLYETGKINDKATYFDEYKFLNTLEI